MTFIKSAAACLLFMVFFHGPVSYAYQNETVPDPSSALFDSEETLNIQLEGDIRSLLRDRGEDPDYHILKLHVQNKGQEELLELRVRVRGNFRRLRKNCDTPPLKFNFKKHEVPDHSLFAGQPELKLVVPCKGEQYVLREYLTYKLYNLFTDYSFNVRLVRFTFNDTGSKEVSDPQYGFLIEDKEVLASRNNASLSERMNLRPEVVDPESFYRLSVFAYMIGNTDWSIQYLHNIEMLFLNEDKLLVAVPYDFDLVGLVSSPYAKPSPALKLRSVRERVYRGYCLEDLRVLNNTFDQFQKLRPEIYRLIREDSLTDDRFKDFASGYLDDFYEILNDKKKKNRAFSYPCNDYGTGNVVISGMQGG
ncbi:hypothetical protein AB2B38_012420 [Balneola sp. MJW-20]|uniref:hypothetical protein n=1 Tax=Gracilimonas aurantiaca TaxID=3234185 RepID=UPI00346750F4